MSFSQRSACDGIISFRGEAASFSASDALMNIRIEAYAGVSLFFQVVEQQPSKALL